MTTPRQTPRADPGDDVRRADRANGEPGATDEHDAPDEPGWEPQPPDDEESAGSDTVER